MRRARSEKTCRRNIEKSAGDEEQFERQYEHEKKNVVSMGMRYNYDECNNKSSVTVKYAIDKLRRDGEIEGLLYAYGSMFGM